MVHSGVLSGPIASSLKQCVWTYWDAMQTCNKQLRVADQTQQFVQAAQARQQLHG